MVEFHVWDFTPHIEVRLNDTFIQRIRDMTVKKKIVQKTKPYLGHGWKKPRAITKVMEKDVKLIAFTVGHPYHKIAERLYAKDDWHGDDRRRVPHRPFISVEEFLIVHKVTRLPLDEMERSIIEVRNHWAGDLEFPMKFPVVANEDWAWMLGLWYSCGGLITRGREGKGGYWSEELSVRYSVDKQVFHGKIVPILRRIAYVPNLGKTWYENKGITHKLDRNKIKGLRAKPRGHFTLVRPVREVMEKFGLPLIRDRKKQTRKGRKYAFRIMYQSVPEWIRASESCSHAFIEGFLNGTQIGSEFRTRPRGIRRTVELRFGGLVKEDVETFCAFFAKTLTKMGIPGYTHHLIKTTTKAYWLGYLIHDSVSLCRLFEKFDIARPDLRARLVLNQAIKQNMIFYYVSRGLTSNAILILGLIIEKSRTFDEILETFRISEERMRKTLDSLIKNRVIQNGDNGYQIKIAVTSATLDTISQQEAKRQPYRVVNMNEVRT